MIVMLPEPGRLKGANLTVEFPFRGQAALGQEFQGPINGSQTDLLIFFTDLPEEFFGRGMPL